MRMGDRIVFEQLRFNFRSAPHPIYMDECMWDECYPDSYGPLCFHWHHQILCFQYMFAFHRFLLLFCPHFLHTPSTLMLGIIFTPFPSVICPYRSNLSPIMHQVHSRELLASAFSWVSPSAEFDSLAYSFSFHPTMSSFLLLRAWLSGSHTTLSSPPLPLASLSLLISIHWHVLCFQSFQLLLSALYWALVAHSMYICTSSVMSLTYTHTSLLMCMIFMCFCVAFYLSWECNCLVTCILFVMCMDVCECVHILACLYVSCMLSCRYVFHLHIFMIYSYKHIYTCIHTYTYIHMCTGCLSSLLFIPLLFFLPASLSSRLR